MGNDLSSVDRGSSLVTSYRFPQRFESLGVLDHAKIFVELEKLELGDDEIEEIVSRGLSSEHGVDRSATALLTLCDQFGRARSLGRSQKSPLELLEALSTHYRSVASRFVLAWAGWATGWTSATIGELDPVATSPRVMNTEELRWLLQAGGERALSAIYSPDRGYAPDRGLSKKQRVHQYVNFSQEALDMVVRDCPLEAAGIANLREEQVLALLESAFRGDIFDVGTLLTAACRYPSTARQLLSYVEQLGSSTPQLNLVEAGMLADAMGKMSDSELLDLLGVSATYAVQLCLFGHFEGVWPRYSVFTDILNLLEERSLTWWTTRLYPARTLQLEYRQQLVAVVPGLAWALRDTDAYQDLVDYVNERLAACPLGESVVRPLFEDRYDAAQEATLSLNSFLERVEPLSRALR